MHNFKVKCRKDVADNNPSQTVFHITIETDNPDIQKMFPTAKVVLEEQLHFAIQEIFAALESAGYLFDDVEIATRSQPLH